MRLVVLLLVSIAGVSNAQNVTSIDPVRATLNRGATAGGIVLPIAGAPAAGDRIVAETSTNLLKITVVTPDGRRINSANADANGFSWSESPLPPVIGSTDGGYDAIIFFKGAGAKGDYRVEFASGALTKSAKVSAWFISDRDQYDQSMKQVPGVQRLGPVSLDSSEPAEELTWSLAADEAGTLIDIVVADSNAKVQLKVRSGEILTLWTPKSNDFEWKSVRSRAEIDPPDSIFGLSGFLSTRDGFHHVVTLKTAAKGNYAVHVEASGSNSAEVEAIVLPLERMFKDATADVGKPPDLPAGTVLLEPVALPYNCFVGDKLDLAVRLVGDPVRDPVRFTVRVETRARLPYNGRGPQQYAPPKVVAAPVSFTRGSDGWYRGAFIPRDPGVARLSIQARGTTTAGPAFTQEVVLQGLTVAPVVATFVSLTERAIDDDGNGHWDRLELTATLDVATPGKYEMRFRLAGANSIGLLGDGEATLATGRQRLAASVPATRLFESLKDGPYEIRDVRIYRPEGNTFSNFVKGAIPPVTTAAYKRDHWDRG